MLREGGIDVVAVVERPDLRHRSDEELLDLAAGERRTLVTRDVSTVRSLLRARWSSGTSNWGVILIASSVRPDPAARAYVAAALARIAAEHPGDDPLAHEVWIAAPSG